MRYPLAGVVIGFIRWTSLDANSTLKLKLDVFLITASFDIILTSHQFLFLLFVDRLMEQLFRAEF